MPELIDILKIGIIAYVFVILTSPGMIFYFYYRLIDRLPYDWLFKPLGGCNMCFAGQLALWFYLIKYFHSYNLFEHIFFICGAILIVMILDKLIDYELEDN
jgi:hypothetical protein